MEIQPLRGYVLAKPITRTNKSKSGLDLPDEMTKNSGPEAEVVSIGAAYDTDYGVTRTCPAHVVVGARVLYKPFSQVVSIGDYLLIHFNDLIAVLSN